MRYINTSQVVACQLTTPAENPLVTDSSRMMDVWFGGAVVRKQLFKKMTKEEQESFADKLTARGFLRTGNLLVDPQGILFADMESELLGGVVTIGFNEAEKPVELKVKGEFMTELCQRGG